MHVRGGTIGWVLSITPSTEQNPGEPRNPTVPNQPLKQETREGMALVPKTMGKKVFIVANNTNKYSSTPEPRIHHSEVVQFDTFLHYQWPLQL